MSPEPKNNEFDVATQTIARDLPAPLGVRVVVAGGGPPGRKAFRLEEGSCIVGSAPTSDVVIDDRSVSRSHVELTIVDGGILVRDLGSRNGTFYMGQRVDQITLSHGASITVGGARLLLEADTEALASLSYDGAEYRGILGVSAPMRRLFATLTRLEGSTISVLVNGESGSGKELVARALHQGSGVSGPLVTFNCGAIARELVMSELFGHKRGAFTGATESRKGAFESADGGTLFLDEIAELPLDVQPSLLRALEAGEIRPVGGDQTSTVKVRVIAATHRDLEREVSEGRFREDLFYRLAVVRLEVPPLRERPEDIPSIAQRFATAVNAGTLPANVLEQLKQRSWPGNARELRNVVQAWAVLGNLPPGPKMSGAALNQSLAGLVDLGRPYAELKDQLLEAFQRVYLAELLVYVKGNQTQAAKLAGMDRTYLGKLLAKYGLGAD